MRLSLSTMGPSALEESFTADGSEQLDARRVEHTHLVLAGEEGRDADISEGSAADHAVRAELVLADPAPEGEALVRGVPERVSPRVVLDVQTALRGKRISHPCIIANVPRLDSLRSVVDRVEGKVRAREDIELQSEVLLPRTRVSQIRSSSKGTPEAKHLRVADAALRA
jgi:hypothetical protein